MTSDDSQQVLGPEFQSSTYYIPAILYAKPVNNIIQSMRFEILVDEKSRFELTRLSAFLSLEF